MIDIGEADVIIGVDVAALTVKLKVPDCPPSGLLTRMPNVPGTLRRADIWKEVALTP